VTGPIVGIGEVLWDLLPSGPRAGGAPFNFAFHCHQLGHPAVIVSRVGDDKLGRALRAGVRELGLSDEFIQTDHAHPTSTVSVSLDADGQPAYTFAPDIAWDHLAWDERFERLLHEASAVCFGTLAQRAPESRETIRRFVGSFGADKLRVCDLNLRPPFANPDVIEESLRLATWVKLNADEWREVAGPQVAGADAVARGWLAGRGLGLLCVTEGGCGCRAWTRHKTAAAPGVPVTVADTVGAGDAFAAALLTQTLEGAPLPRALRFANAYAALVASRPGGTPRVERAEAERLC
jgi:fructokinase